MVRYRNVRMVRMHPIQRTRSFYDRHARRWSEFHTNFFHHEPQFRRFVRHFKTGDAVLDIGSANGIHVPLFLGIGRRLRYFGIDISRAFVTIARTRYPRFSFQVANIADQRTLPKRRFDGFWAVAVLMHVPERQWPVMLENTERLIRHGGVGYFTLPRQRPNPPSRQDRRHFTLMPTAHILRYLRARGWKVLARGVLHGTTVPNNWRWFIVRLP